MSGRNVTVVGLQWGDEGKGKIVDALAGHMRYVVRFCGGANAGHTVLVGAEKFALHLIPCGVLRQGVCNIVGNGVAFDPAVAWGELSALRERGVSVDSENLRISSAANVVMPWHKLQDTLSEASLGEGKKIGTTARGIGPCYSDKANRTTAIRAADLVDPDILAEKIPTIVDIKNRIFAALYNAEPMDADAILAEYIELGQKLAPMICNTGGLLRQAIAQDIPILFEGGQGSMLDVDHGTYPFVTSSNVTACGVPSGAGVPPSEIGRVVGLIKAYSTRVGEGPFPTEQDNEIGNTIRQAGNEYGTTTGRPRRCGWFDAFATKYATDLSGADELALSLLDVLTGLGDLKICTGYTIDGVQQEMFDPTQISNVECTYKTLPGWDVDITGCKTFEELPQEAQDYVNYVEEMLQRPVGFVSVGPERSQTIVHHSKTQGLDK
ncbi:MAG: adenylosuccinate synthase [bacterium]|nr:adenylosuccinate synthase [bacterium]